MVKIGYSYRAGGYEKDKGFSLGDYPALPWRSAQELPAQGWWDDQDRRNKGDPVGIDISIKITISIFSIFSCTNKMTY